ncbi:MAG: hypothetical protein ACK58T_42270 [Phycisphaerae bacterium]|jgi:hypothetical protein
MVAWFLSLFVFACLNMTPLYRGRDNGDGTNHPADCALLVILFLITFTALMIALQRLASSIAGRLREFLSAGITRNPRADLPAI